MTITCFDSPSASMDVSELRDEERGDVVVRAPLVADRPAVDAHTDAVCGYDAHTDAV